MGSSWRSAFFATISPGGSRYCGKSRTKSSNSWRGRGQGQNKKARPTHRTSSSEECAYHPSPLFQNASLPSYRINDDIRSRGLKFYEIAASVDLAPEAPFPQFARKLKIAIHVTAGRLRADFGCDRLRQLDDQLSAGGL